MTRMLTPSALDDIASDAADLVVAAVAELPDDPITRDALFRVMCDRAAQIAAHGVVEYLRPMLNIDIATRRAWQRLHHLGGDVFYRRLGCPRCTDGLVPVRPVGPGEPDTATCGCVRAASEIPEGEL